MSISMPEPTAERPRPRLVWTATKGHMPEPEPVIMQPAAPAASSIFGQSLMSLPAGDAADPEWRIPESSWQLSAGPGGQPRVLAAVFSQRGGVGSRVQVLDLDPDSARFLANDLLRLAEAVDPW